MNSKKNLVQKKIPVYEWPMMEQFNGHMDPSLVGLFEYRPRKGDLKKLEIISAAIESLATQGIEKTSYESIAKILGTRRAHIAYHFEDKHDIFKASIRYILTTYQKITLESLQKAANGEELLGRYIEAAFDWAKTHPHQLSVAILLKHLANVREDYRPLQLAIRKSESDRLSFILTNRLENNLESDAAYFLSSTILNLTLGSVISCALTTKDFDQSKREVLRASACLFSGLLQQ